MWVPAGPAARSFVGNSLSQEIHQNSKATMNLCLTSNFHSFLDSPGLPILCTSQLFSGVAIETFFATQLQAIQQFRCSETIFFSRATCEQEFSKQRNTKISDNRSVAELQSSKFRKILSLNSVLSVLPRLVWALAWIYNQSHPFDIAPIRHHKELGIHKVSISHTNTNGCSER